MFPPDSLFLVVDDSNVIRENVRKELGGLGYTSVVEAEDGQKALVLLETSPVKVIISDWNMPVMSGIEFLKKVRGTPKWANLPFVMLTSASQVSEVVDAISAGVSTYIVKPLDRKSLKDKLLVVWQKHYGPKK